MAYEHLSPNHTLSVPGIDHRLACQVELSSTFPAKPAVVGDETEYSCFEKGCLTNGRKLTRQSRKLLWVMAVFTVA